MDRVSVSKDARSFFRQKLEGKHSSRRETDLHLAPKGPPKPSYHPSKNLMKVLSKTFFVRCRFLQNEGCTDIHPPRDYLSYSSYSKLAFFGLLERSIMALPTFIHNLIHYNKRGSLGLKDVMLVWDSKKAGSKMLICTNWLLQNAY